MAESGVISEQNLPDLFKEIWRLYDILEKTDEPTGSDKVQVDSLLTLTIISESNKLKCM